MWFVPTKIELKKELKKIKNRFLTSKESINDLKNQVNSNKEKIAKLEGALSVILNQSKHKEISSPSPVPASPSQFQPVPTSSSQFQNNFESKIINKIKRNKKLIVMAEINRLKDSHSLMDMYHVIVLEKKLCAKTSFYRYISSSKSPSQSQKLVGLEQN